MLDESDQQNEAAKGECGGPQKCLTFKEWKSLKDHNKNNGNCNVKLTTRNKYNGNDICDIKNELNYNISNNFLPFNNFNRLDFSNCVMHENNCQPLNNFSAYNIFKNLTNSIVQNKFANSNEIQNIVRQHQHGCKNSNRDNGFDQSMNFFTSNCVSPQRDMMYEPVLNPFRDGYKNSSIPDEFANLNELQNSFRKYDQGYKNSNRDSTFHQLKNFFTSDSVYPQRDMICKPVSNPLRDDDRGYRKGKKIKTRGKPNKKIPSNHAKRTASADAKKKISDGKKYIPKPKIPEQDSNLTYEERKQQWKDYRQAMKPFKNRDFYNAKRVVQRLGKKMPSELNDAQLIRLLNAQEHMAGHKARLIEKHEKYVKAEDGCNQLGEVFVLKTVPRNQSNSSTISSIQQKLGDFSKSLHNNNFGGILNTSSQNINN